MRIAVAGGTGLAGRLVVLRAREQGHDVVVLARSTGVDLVTGAGLAPMLEGVDVVVDTSNVTTSKRVASERFFGAATAHLLASGAAAGVAHHVVLSIVGIDDVPLGYYQGKREQERLVAASGRPATIVRSTQFHEFVDQLSRQGSVGPLTLVPVMPAAPVAAAEVADALVEVAGGAPYDGTVEMTGPHVESMPDLVRRLVRHRGSQRPVVPLWLPGSAAGEARKGRLLSTHPWRTGRQSFEEWLAEQPG
jgi:uncharacterized protein YbjT (DUF2867 family)